MLSVINCSPPPHTVLLECINCSPPPHTVLLECINCSPPPHTVLLECINCSPPPHTVLLECINCSPPHTVFTQCYLSVSTVLHFLTQLLSVYQLFSNFLSTPSHSVTWVYQLFSTSSYSVTWVYQLFSTQCYYSVECINCSPLPELLECINCLFLTQCWVYQLFPLPHTVLLEYTVLYLLTQCYQSTSSHSVTWVRIIYNEYQKDYQRKI